MWILSVAGTSKIICKSAVAGATPYVSENVEHFAAQSSRVEALGQSRYVKVQLCTDMAETL